MENLSKERVFSVTGMSCGHCQRAVEAAIGQLEGVQSARVDLKTGQAKVIGDVESQAVSDAVKEAGYEARPIGP
jgi:copper chaperone